VAHRSQQRDESVERLLRQSGQSLCVAADTGLTDGCLDAETLAAWAEGGLSGATLDTAQSHVAGCGRCQALLGALARIESAAAPVQPARGARAWLPWLVPIATAAVVVGVWVAVSRDQLNRVTEPPQTEEAQKTKAVTEPQAQAPATAVDQFQIAPPARNGERSLRSAGPENAPKQEVRRDARTTSEADSLNKQATATAAPEMPSPAPAARAPAARAAAAAPSPYSANTLDSAASTRLRAETAGVETVSPDPNVRGRIAGSSVQRSTNRGASWDVTPTGLATELTAGAAPSASVCWLIGRAGVVLLSIDGVSWQRVPFPEATDLSAIRARDAQSASVSTADGRTFSTTNGGIAWVSGPLQGF